MPEVVQLQTYVKNMLQLPYWARDITPIEQYRAYIKATMAKILRFRFSANVIPPMQSWFAFDCPLMLVSATARSSELTLLR